MSHIWPRKHSRRLSSQERELLLDLLYQEALHLAHDQVPFAEMDRQLRELRRDLVQAIRAGIQFTDSNSPEHIENQEK